MIQADPATNWGLVELDVIRRIREQISDDFAKYVRSAVSEDACDEMAKGYTTIFTWSNGTRARRSGKSGSGYLQLDEDWMLTVLIYAQDGRVDDEARFGAKGLHAVSALVKGALNAYAPSDQTDNDGCLELLRDEPVSEYRKEAGSYGYKVRHTYVLKTILKTLVTGAAAA